MCVMRRIHVFSCETIVFVQVLRVRMIMELCACAYVCVCACVLMCVCMCVVVVADGVLLFCGVQRRPQRNRHRRSRAHKRAASQHPRTPRPKVCCSIRLICLSTSHACRCPGLTVYCVTSTEQQLQSSSGSSSGERTGTGVETCKQTV